MGVDTAASDRLPWLPDDVAFAATPPRRTRLLPWALGALLVAATAGSWMGLRSVDPAAVPVAPHPQHSLTLQLPPARPPLQPAVRIQAPQDVRPLPVPQVRPTPLPDVHITTPAHAKLTRHSTMKSASGADAVSSRVDEHALAPPPVPQNAIRVAPRAPGFVLNPWNPRVIAGAAGRLVQIGAFGSVPQAKRGWWSMVRSYPAMAHLPAVVRPTRNSKGRTFFRFQVGTTSQAHSEVLCQRMQTINFSCAVIGLPWKAKVER